MHNKLLKEKASSGKFSTFGIRVSFVLNTYCIVSSLNHSFIADLNILGKLFSESSEDLALYRNFCATVTK